jgi:hypothetical protein
VVVVGFVVVVVGFVVVVVGLVVVVVGWVVVVVGSVVVVVVPPPPPEAGVKAMVAATGELCGTFGDHRAGKLGFASDVLSFATAACELPELFSEAPRSDPGGAFTTSCQALLPSPRTSIVPEVVVSTLGESLPALAADASTGSELLTPEKASVTIETCVAGLIRTSGSTWPTVATATHAASRAPLAFAASRVSVQPESQLREVNE